MKVINLIFDYDGTLHNSIHIYAPAFRHAYEHLVMLGKAKPREWTNREISQWLGLSSKDMWNRFMPNLSQAVQDECSSIIGNLMLELVQQGKAVLYPSVLEVLHKLKSKGYNMIFLSNCKHSYMKAHIEEFHLDDFFSDFYCTEDYDFKPKFEIFKIIKKNNPGEFIVIGDRYQDIEIAKIHELHSIGCGYGYGMESELFSATVIVQTPIEILRGLVVIKDLNKVM